MSWGLKFGATVTGVASAMAIASSAAFAADLGGDCCADLEERVAELEATTVRKGNRKVSLEISGQVNEALLYWDDGDEKNAYIVTNDNARTRFRFKGKAKVTDDVEAGYIIEIGVRTANSKRFTQLNDEGNDTATDVGFDIRDSNWYLKSKTYGALSLGRQATATDAITEINLSQTADFSKYSDVEDTGLGLFLRAKGSAGNAGLSGLSWRRLIGDGGDQPGEGERRFDAVKYVSPTWSGFTVSASWGEDDFWDVALRYAGEFNGIKISAGIGYGELTDGPETQTTNAAFERALPGGDSDGNQVGGSISVLHVASGLFVNFAAGEKTDERIDETIGSATTAGFSGTGVDDGQDFFAVQAGIERKFIDLGKTTIYGEYYSYEGGGNQRRVIAATDPINPFGVSSRIFSTGVESYGAGIAQGIDAAAMVIYLSYRHLEADLTILSGTQGAGTLADAQLDDLDVVLTGAIIKF